MPIATILHAVLAALLGVAVEVQRSRCRCQRGACLKLMATLLIATGKALGCLRPTPKDIVSTYTASPKLVFTRLAATLVSAGTFVVATSACGIGCISGWEWWKVLRVKLAVGEAQGESFRASEGSTGIGDIVHAGAELWVASIEANGAVDCTIDWRSWSSEDAADLKSHEGDKHLEKYHDRIDETESDCVLDMCSNVRYWIEQRKW